MSIFGGIKVFVSKYMPPDCMYVGKDLGDRIREIFPDAKQIWPPENGQLEFDFVNSL